MQPCQSHAPQQQAHVLQCMQGWHGATGLTHVNPDVTCRDLGQFVQMVRLTMPRTYQQRFINNHMLCMVCCTYLACMLDRSPPQTAWRIRMAGQQCSFPMMHVEAGGSTGKHIKGCLIFRSIPCMGLDEGSHQFSIQLSVVTFA